MHSNKLIGMSQHDTILMRGKLNNTTCIPIKLMCNNLKCCSIMLIFAENQPLAERIIVEVLLGELKF
jgi:hypothetical protein